MKLLRILTTLVAALTAIVGLAFTAFAAPIPLTSSSLFISKEKGLFRSPIGFSLHAAGTGWEQLPAPKNNNFIETIYRAAGNGDDPAALTVRVDQTPKAYGLDEYAQKWMKDYPRFGFDVLTAKKVKVGEGVGFMLDLINRDNSKQLRQVLFLKQRHVVTLTCRDDVSTFASTLKNCNEIMRTFKW